MMDRSPAHREPVELLARPMARGSHSRKRDCRKLISREIGLGGMDSC